MFVTKTKPYSRIPAFTVSEKAQKQKLRNNMMKGSQQMANRRIKSVQGSNKSKDRETDLIYKEV